MQVKSGAASANSRLRWKRNQESYIAERAEIFKRRGLMQETVNFSTETEENSFVLNLFSLRILLILLVFFPKSVEIILMQPQERSSKYGTKHSH